MDDGGKNKKNMVFLYTWDLKTRNNVNENSNYYKQLYPNEQDTDTKNNSTIKFRNH